MVERALSMREVMGSMPIFSMLLDSIVVSVHADDPGSIPGRGVKILMFRTPSVSSHLTDHVL
jgi:hypothetical protein